MVLNKLLEQKKDLNSNIIKCIDDEILMIKISAENMIECATNIQGQGYTAFIQARENFIEKIDTFHENFKGQI